MAELHPTEKALREKITLLESRCSDLIAQTYFLGAANEQVIGERDRYLDSVMSIRQLLGFCEQVGAQPTVEILRDCLRGKHLSLLMADLSIPTME